MSVQVQGPTAGLAGSTRSPFVGGLAGARPDERRPEPLAETIAAARDEASISEAGRRALQQERELSEQNELSDGEREQQRELEARDREVRAHEQAHKVAAGSLAVGGPTYTYQTGPDGKRYAIGGSVQIRLQSGRTPEETLRNMERAIRAANAPQSPSGPDRAVAAQAARMAAEARREIQAERNESSGGGGDRPGPRPLVDVLA